MPSFFHYVLGEANEETSRAQNGGVREDVGVGGGNFAEHLMLT